MSNEIASLNPSDVLDKTAKFFRVMEKAGVSWEKFQIPINDIEARSNLAEYLNRGCPKNETKTFPTMSYRRNYFQARALLGEDFISPEEIAFGKKMLYDERTLGHFSETYPSKETLEWIRDNSFVLIAGPPTSMLFKKVYDYNSNWIIMDEKVLKAAWSIQRDKVKTNWLILRKGIVSGSVGKSLGEQTRLLAEEEHIPNICEVIWAFGIFKKLRRRHFFPASTFARTTSMVNPDDSVYFRLLDDGTMYVDHGWSDSHVMNLGIITARKNQSK